jgi:hypothetical protein
MGRHDHKDRDFIRSWGNYDVPFDPDMDSDFDYDDNASYMRVFRKEVVGPVPAGPINENPAASGVQKVVEDRSAQNLSFTAWRADHKCEKRGVGEEDAKLSTQSPWAASQLSS